LEAGDEAARSKHEECVALPVVEKRVVIPKPKAEARPARPADAPVGSQKCPYCEEWLPLYHREHCRKMPFDIWVRAVRDRDLVKHGPEVVGTWTIQCQHCATPFEKATSKRVHLSGCERRRVDAGLPLNTFPAMRMV